MQKYSLLDFYHNFVPASSSRSLQKRNDLDTKRARWETVPKEIQAIPVRQNAANAE